MTLDIDGLLYQLAVYKQDLLEEPILTTIKAEPNTLAKIAQWFPKEDRKPLKYLPGIELVEAPGYPPGQVYFVDQYGSVLRQVSIRA